MAELTLRMTDGTQIVVPASLDSITTYVILEQEKWFEKETAFLGGFLKPGMLAIDIGANLGVYSLPMARLVTPGAVFAYEPASEPRGLLARSMELNKAANLRLLPLALSDRAREGTLVLGASSELNALEGAGPGERVTISSLDAEQESKGWPRVDFMKIDAEGEEERILAGGTNFFAKHSPLVMFEVKAGSRTNDNLPAAFRRLGFRIYRLLDGAPVLVPVVTGERLDGYELNLFAARPEQAAALARNGLLAEAVPGWNPDDSVRKRGLAFLKAQPFAPILAALPDGGDVKDPVYRDALAAYAAWRMADISLPERVAALNFACVTLTALCTTQASLSRLSSLARISREAGRRGDSVNVLRQISDILRHGNSQITEPFWPANPRFDTIAPGPNVVEWFMIGTLEQLELTATFSSRFGDSGVDLGWLAKQKHVSVEIERRLVLRQARFGQPVEISPRLHTPAADHLNADAWHVGRLPKAGSANQAISDSGDKSIGPANTADKPNTKAQNVSPPLFRIAALLPPIPRLKIVDVGAMSIGSDPYAALAAATPCEVYGFEPVAKELEKLRASARPGQHYLPHVVGDGSTRTFHECNYSMTSSLFEPNAPLVAKFQNLEELMRVTKTHQVETKRLDDIPELVGTDYLKIDVQGAELLVLAGACRILENALVVHTEVNFVQLYKDCPLFAEIDVHLRSKGFALHRLSQMGRTFKPLLVNNNPNAALSQILWGDAVYVRDFMGFDRMEGGKLLKLATVLHENYRSFDLVAVALAAYDRQNATALQKRYLKKLAGIN